MIYNQKLFLNSYDSKIILIINIRQNKEKLAVKTFMPKGMGVFCTGSAVRLSYELNCVKNL